MCSGTHRVHGPGAFGNPQHLGTRCIVAAVGADGGKQFLRWRQDFTRLLTLD